MLAHIFHLKCPEAGQTRGCTEQPWSTAGKRRQSSTRNVPRDGARWAHPEGVSQQLVFNVLGGEPHLQLSSQITFLATYKMVSSTSHIKCKDVSGWFLYYNGKGLQTVFKFQTFTLRKYGEEMSLERISKLILYFIVNSSLVPLGTEFYMILRILFLSKTATEVCPQNLHFQ